MPHLSPSEQFKSLQKHRLLRKSATDLDSALIADHPQILPLLISRDLVKRRSFYPNLAQAYNLAYYDIIPRSLDTRHAIVHQIPIELLMEQIVYPMEDHDRLILVTFTPFLDPTVQERIRSYTQYHTVEVAIASPILIRDMLEETHRQVADIVSAHQTMVFHPDSSVQRYRKQPTIEKIIIGLAIFGALLLIIAYPVQILIIAFVIINLLYLIINPFKLVIFFASFFERQTLSFTPKQVKAVSDTDFPMYTILVPLRFEAIIAHQIVTNISKIDYPKERLDVKFIINIDDQETIDAIKDAGISVASDDARSTDFWAHVVEAPSDKYTTKPRVCNYALASARGMFTVIYDAEDRPETTQVKKAYMSFFKSSLDTACVQCKLNFYNSHQNLLTRLFALEYGFWFEYFLPGLQRVASPIPLGGTSNHFITNALKRLGTWDPYNVTEDADLGLRIARLGYRTRVLDSTTYEEANSRLINWIKQRTRWQKGFVQTFFVHIKDPIVMFRQLGWYQFMHAMVTFGSNVFLPYINPFLYAVFFISLIEYALSITILDIPVWAQTTALINLYAGNIMYLSIHAISAIRTRRYDLFPFVVFIPLYWILISIATHRAVLQYIFKPYVWEKTQHGLR